MTTALHIATSLVITALLTSRAAGQPVGSQRDSVAVDSIAPGVTSTFLFQPAGPFRIHVVTIDLRRNGYALMAARAGDSLQGREKTSDLARRAAARGFDVIAALNADFFDLETGENENNQVIEGRFLKGTPVTDSPFDAFRNAHIQFAMTKSGRPLIDRFTFAGSVRVGRKDFVLDGLNGVPRVADALVFFDGARAGAPRTDSVRRPTEVRLAQSGRTRHGAPRWRAAGRVHDLDTLPIPPRGGSLVAFGAARARLDSILARGGRLTIRYGLRPDRGPLTTVLGGWPRVVEHGRNIGAFADSIEGTFPRFSSSRHPRSAIGFSRDSNTVYLVAVDGRSENSGGMTLTELGDCLLSLGVWDGMNFDGGGSTTLVVRGRVVNSPSDPGGERAVGNALLVVRK
jgi:hypothetical protein